MRGAGSFLSLVAVLTIAACQAPTPAGKTDAPAPAKVEAPKPDAEWAKGFEACTWGEVKGGGVSLWAFACKDDKIVYDASIPGFARELSGADPIKSTVVQFFSKPAEAALDAALPAIRAASKGAETCVLEQIKDAPAGQFQLMPTGAARTSYDAFLAGKNDNANLMPCGPLGPSEAGMRVIQAMPGAPTMVAVIHMPSDVGTFDPKTLRAAP